MLDLSIIIPMYNCRGSIVHCLDSIDYKNAEIIVVDDGSIDDGYLQVKSYIEAHDNVRIIRKENEGVSSARNVGIKNASGQYIMFMDADDFLSQEGIKKVLEIAMASNADVVKYKIRSICGGIPECYPSVGDFEITTTVMKGKGVPLLRNDISDYHVVDAVFKRSLIINNGILFYEDLSLREDDVFMCEVYCVSNIVIGTNLPLYNYVRCSSYSSTHHQKREIEDRLINSEVKAIRYRKEILNKYFGDKVFPLEKYKYMRYTFGAIKRMIDAKYTQSAIKEKITEFIALGSWPISYKWIGVARTGYSFRMIFKTFLYNHPLCARFFNLILGK